MFAPVECVREGVQEDDRDLPEFLREASLCSVAPKRMPPQHSVRSTRAQLHIPFNLQTLTAREQLTDSSSKEGMRLKT
jgi:hypothetical protein